MKQNFFMSRSNIVSAVATFLQAMNVVPKGQDIIDIKFGDLSKDMVEIDLIMKDGEEVTVKYFTDATPQSS